MLTASQPTHHPFTRRAPRRENRVKRQFATSLDRVSDFSSANRNSVKNCGFAGRDITLAAIPGLWYFRARYYDAEMGRFIGRDPLGYVDGMGLYATYFVPGLLDPYGLTINLVGSAQERADLLSAMQQLCPDLSMDASGNVTYTGSLTDEDCECIKDGMTSSSTSSDAQKKLCCCFRELAASSHTTSIGSLPMTGGGHSTPNEPDTLQRPDGSPGPGANSSVIIGTVEQTTTLPLSGNTYSSPMPVTIAHEVCGHSLEATRGTAVPEIPGIDGGNPWDNPAYPRDDQDNPVPIPPSEEQSMAAESNARLILGLDPANSYY